MIARVSLGVLAAVFVALKLFTVEITLRDDPTSMLAARSTPSLVNPLHDLPPGAVVLAADENGFAADDAWRWITSVGWILLPAAWIAAQAGSRLRGAR